MDINPFDPTHRLGPSARRHDLNNYMKKVQNLLNEKNRIIADDLSDDIKMMRMFDVEKSKEIIKKRTGGCKRPLTSTEKTIRKKKKMMIVRTPVVSNRVTDELKMMRMFDVEKSKEIINKTKKKTGGCKRPEMKIRKKKKMIVRTPVVSNHVTDELKEFVTEEMNGSDMKLVIQKSLYAADLKKDQNRLSMPMNQVETHEFLTADEKMVLEKGGEVAVPLLGPTLRMHEEPMVLKIWHLRSSNNYVLKTKWNEFVKANEKDLKEETKIQVWSFRRDGQQLCFAIACVDRPHSQINGAA